MPALKDMLSPQDQKWAENRAKEAKNPRYRGDIPPELYQAVAEILAYVYGLKEQKNQVEK